MPKVTTFLWFNNQAEEAANLYTSVFKNARVLSMERRGSGEVISATFEIDGQEFIAFNGGPHFAFTPATSLFVNCETQAEVDALWDRLSAGGEKGQCGWLKDRYGLSWQIVPAALSSLLHHKDPAKANRVMQAMLKMSKLDIAALQQAAE